MSKNITKIGMQFFGGIKNLSIEAQKKTEILQRMTTAIKDNDTEGFSQAWDELADAIQQAVLADAQEVIASNDASVLAQRGVRQLTSEESKYWQKAIDAMRSKDPKQAVTLIDEVMPTTVIDEIFKYIRAAHPLLDAINVQNVGAITRIITATTSGAASWGELCAAIDAEIAGSVSYLDMTLNKLFAKMIVCNAMLDLGPVWLDRFAREALGEAIAVQLEEAFADGDGNGKPLGMTRALSGATDGVYPRKTATAITALDPTTYGTILNTLSQAPNGKRRAISSVLLVVNPSDYFTKIFPATTPRSTTGGFTQDVFPFPTTVVQSAAVPVGYAVMGLASEYFAGAGAGTNGGKLEYDDSVKFLDDARAYRIKVYANGRPKDTNAFIYLDITGLVPYVQQVYVTNSDEFPTA